MSPLWTAPWKEGGRMIWAEGATGLQCSLTKRPELWGWNAHRMFQTETGGWGLFTPALLGKAGSSQRQLLGMAQLPALSIQLFQQLGTKSLGPKGGCAPVASICKTWVLEAFWPSRCSLSGSAPPAFLFPTSLVSMPPTITRKCPTFSCLQL